MANKAGTCKCGHEIRYWHDPETGHCMVGREWKGHAANAYGACPCVRKVKAKKMNGTKRTFKAATTAVVTVRRDVIARALGQIIEGFTTLRDEILLPSASVNALDLVREMEGAKSITQLLEPAPASSSRAEVPTSAAPARGDVETHTTPFNTLSTGAGVVLDALAMGFSTNDELIAVTGYAERTLQNLLSELSGYGFIHRDRGVSAITDGGRAQTVGHDLTVPKIDDLMRTWCARLGEGERKCLTFIRTTWKNEKRWATLAELAEHAVLAERTVQNCLTELSKWRLIHRDRGRAAPSEVLGGPS